MSKVIDITSRLKTVAQLNSQGAPNDAQVLNYSEQKNKILFQERREIKRTILTEFVSAMVVVPNKGLLKVNIYDISENGVSFDVESEYGGFSAEETVSMRVYLNQKAYFPFTVQVKHVTNEHTEGVVRHGCIFQRDGSNDVALRYFVQFVESVSGGLRTDSGDLMVPKIS